MTKTVQRDRPISQGANRIRMMDPYQPRLRVAKAARPLDEVSGPPSLYFIEAGENGPIKIGVALDPAARVRQLQTASPAPLRLLAVVPEGGVFLEASLHTEFAEHQLCGEWFERIPALLERIAGIEVLGGWRPPEG